MKYQFKLLSTALLETIKIENKVFTIICLMSHKESGTNMLWVILSFLRVEMSPNISQD